MAIAPLFKITEGEYTLCSSFRKNDAISIMIDWLQPYGALETAELVAEFTDNVWDILTGLQRGESVAIPNSLGTTFQVTKR